MATYDARRIANYLLDLADGRGEDLTQISLLKILYFAHGWYLVQFNKPLIRQNFEAWEHGPVVRVVRDAFKSFGSKPIKGRADCFNLLTGQREPLVEKIEYQDTDFVEKIYLAYHIYDAWTLSDMTHEKNSPWDKLWNSVEPVGRLSLRIKNEEIASHFSGLNRRILLS